MNLLKIFFKKGVMINKSAPVFLAWNWSKFYTFILLGNNAKVSPFFKKSLGKPTVQTTVKKKSKKTNCKKHSQQFIKTYMIRNNYFFVISFRPTFFCSFPSSLFRSLIKRRNLNSSSHFQSCLFLFHNNKYDFDFITNWKLLSYEYKMRKSSFLRRWMIYLNAENDEY